MMIKKEFLSVCTAAVLAVCIVMTLLVYLEQSGSAQSHTVAFPLGLMGPSVDYEPPSLGSLSEKLSDVVTGGFNIVYEFRAVQEINDAENYLNQAEAAGLQVVQNMPLCRAYESDDPICQQYPVDVWSELEWATFITTLATYDDLIAWFLPDEIDNYQAAANLYQWVHTYDPFDRPVYANPGSFEQSAINQFPAFSDFLWAVSYPELFDEPRALTTHMVTMFANACRGTDSKWGAILQFFDSTQFPHYGTVGYPTPRELRSDSYQAIIGGAKGLWYFNYEMGRGDELDGLWNEMITITAEIIGSGGLVEVILAPDVPQGIEKHIVSGPTQSPPTQGQVYDSIQFLQKWREGEGTYLFAVNIATDTIVVEFDNLWAETDTVEVLFEGRTIPITDDAFSDTFAQDDVHIYFYAAPQPAAPLASLTIVKTDSPDPVAAGATLTYTLIYANDGPSDALGVILTDTLPPEVTFDGMVSVAPSLFGPTQTGQHLIWHTPTLTAGSSGNIVFTVTVNAAASGIITNSVIITSSTLDDNPDNNDAAELTLVTPVADLIVIKSDTPDPVAAGVPLTYTLVYTNNGPSDAQGVTLTDNLPPQVTFGGVVSVVAPLFGPTQTGQGLVWYTPTLAASAWGNVIFTVTVDAAASGAIINSVVITSSTLDDNPDNNDATELTLITPIADLTVSKTDDPDPVAAGVTLTYTLVYTNNGPSDAQDITLIDALPPEVTLGGVVSIAPSLFGPTQTGQGIVWYTPTLAAGAWGNIIFTVTVNAAASGDITNSVVIVSNTPDDNFDNNNDDELTLVALIADLSVIEADLPDPVTVGNTLTYAITVTNNGPSAASGVMLTDTLPASVTFDSAMPSQGNCNGTHTVTCNLGALADGATATVSIVVTPTTVEMINNRVGATGNEIDSNMANNTATEDTTVNVLIYLPLMLKEQ